MSTSTVLHLTVESRAPHEEVHVFAVHNGDPSVNQSHVSAPHSSVERSKIIEEALRRAGDNRSTAAKFLKIPRQTLVSRLKKVVVKDTRDRS